jgi:hypothetical protein
MFPCIAWSLFYSTDHRVLFYIPNVSTSNMLCQAPVGDPSPVRQTGHQGSECSLCTRLIPGALGATTQHRHDENGVHGPSASLLLPGTSRCAADAWFPWRKGAMGGVHNGKCTLQAHWPAGDNAMASGLNRRNFERTFDISEGRE